MADLPSVGGLEPLGERHGRASHPRDPRSPAGQGQSAEHESRPARADSCAVTPGEQVAFGVLRERVLHATCERLGLAVPRTGGAFARGLPATPEQAVLWVRADQHALLHGGACEEAELVGDFARGLAEAEALLREVGQCGAATADWFAHVRAALAPRAKPEARRS